MMPGANQVLAAQKVRPSLSLNGRRLAKALRFNGGQDVRKLMEGLLEVGNGLHDGGRARLVKIRHNNVITASATVS